MKIGILGGGQLGRMLWEASKALSGSLKPSPIYHESKNCPAGIAGAEMVEAAITDVTSLTSFFKNTDSFAIENEFLPLPSLQQAWQQALKPARVPSPSWLGLEIAQDKLEQKKFFLRNGFPTSDFVEITPSWFEGDSQQMSGLHGTWKGLVLKKARMGYDGKGNLALPPFSSQTSAANLTPSLDLKKIKAFCESAFSTGSRVYAEKFVPFAKEVALVSVRSFAGDYGHFPLVETVQHNGVCFLAFKALHSEVLQARAREIAQALGENLKLLGTYAVEFFVTAQGDLIVNEMAPRVHNSGHFTQKAARSSQFEMHLKSYYQSKFEADDFHCAPAFAMVNLLGPSGFSGPVQKPTQSGIYWYDKESTTPGRKLGHIIAQSSQESELPKLLESLQQSERHWRESLLKA